MKKLGVIGGLGPMAGVYFLELVTRMTDAKTDQEHLEVVMVSSPSTPDRTGFILGKSHESPLPALTNAGMILKNSGADIIALPCFTAHFFHDELEKKLQVPIIHAIKETVSYLRDRRIKCAGIMATEGTVTSRLYQDALEAAGISFVTPDSSGQNLVSYIIYDNVKASKPVDLNAFNAVSSDLFDRGAEVILLGCTELSIVKRDYELPAGFLDVMEVLSQKAVMECGKLRSEYKELITK